MTNEYVCVDIETTGCKPMENKIIEIGAVKVKDGKIVDTFSRLIDPECNIPYYITNLTGITNDMVKGQDTIHIVLKEFIDFAEGDVIMGHNIMFDYSFLKCNAMVYNYKLEKRGIDTLKIARKTMPELESKGWIICADILEFLTKIIIVHLMMLQLRLNYIIFCVANLVQSTRKYLNHSRLCVK